ncbi:hypothetical protein TESS_TESS_00320 [Tessaracoccus sp. O5.2]
MIAVLGQQLTADLAFTKTGSGFTVAVAHLGMVFTAGGATLATFTGTTRRRTASRAPQMAPRANCAGH